MAGGTARAPPPETFEIRAATEGWPLDSRRRAPHLRRRQHRDPHRHYGAQAARGLVPAVVRREPDSHVGLRPRDPAIRRRQRSRDRAVRLQPRAVPQDDAGRHPAGEGLGGGRPERQDDGHPLSLGGAHLVSSQGRRHRDRRRGVLAAADLRGTALLDRSHLRRHRAQVRRTREFLNTIVENVPALLLVKEPREQRYILINRQAEEFFGISRDDVIGKTAYDIFPSGQADVMGRRDKEVLRTGVPMLVEDNRVETAAMGARLVTSKRIAIRDDQGEAQYLLTVIEDVTDRKRQEDEVRRTREFLDTVVENVPATLIVRDARDGRYMLINRSGEELYGVTRDEMVGKTPYDIFPSDEAEAIVARDHEVMQSGQTMIVDGLSVHTPRKGVRLVRSKRLKIEGQDGSSQYVMSFVEDITEYKRAEERIAHLAHHDALTDLPNRVSFTDRFAATLEQAARSNHSFAILCIDIDRFKEVNDVFGHSAGDALLREVSRRLCVAAEGAFLARLGGDEFTIIAEGPQPATAEALAERLLAGVAEDLDIAGHRLRIGLSVGIAIYPADGRDTGALLANADAALYRAKAEGRGTYRFFEPDMDKRLRERRALQHDLRSAVEKGELSLHYQPQALIGGDIIGFEALVRWQHPSIGTVPPHVFIPLAEENGLIMAIGEWVLREACREAASWPRHLQIAVNM